jgi:hypothetical protein
VPESAEIRPPAGWTASPNGAHEVDLRIAGRGRDKIAWVALTLAGLCAWQAANHWSDSTPHAAAPWLGLAVLLGLFAGWCALADEVWQLGANRLAHRVGIGAWSRERDYRDAELEIVGRTSTEFNVPYFRLYVVTSGQRHFLFDRRSAGEVEQLAAFVASITGWRVSRGLQVL